MAAATNPEVGSAASEIAKSSAVEDNSTQAQEQPEMSGALPDSTNGVTKDDARDADVVKDSTHGAATVDHKSSNGDGKEKDDSERTAGNEEDRGEKDRKWKHDKYSSRSGDRRHHSNNKSNRFSNLIKSNFDNLPETDDPEEIRRQVEFYFSDANLPIDAYLLNATGGSENKPFPLKELHTFKRMKRFQPFSAVVNAVKESNILDVNDQDAVSRKEPLSTDYGSNARFNRRIHEDKTAALTLHIRGFGEENENTQTEVEEFFSPFGDIKAVRLNRNYNTKEFRGSVNVEFVDEDAAKQFLTFDNKPLWKDNIELEYMLQTDWLAQKVREQEERDEKDEGRRGSRGHHDRDRRHNGDHRGSRNHRGGHRDGRQRSDRDRNDRRNRDRRDRRDRDDKDEDVSREDREDREGSRRNGDAADHAVAEVTKPSTDATEQGESKKRAREEEQQQQQSAGAESKDVSEPAQKKTKGEDD